ncbi:alpha/beta fold hydrolase [Promicromonospora panici]|uniref:alpha/beta fold hydrolase n=1 Tax=Promicromonospora panici TaxID=2219658 RepID=UPI00101DE09A|nr:alpha/beta hydrolase [Promicromonospora panici]
MSRAPWRALAPFVTMLRRPWQRRRNARTLAAVPEAGVNRQQWVRLGGIEQWITVRGHDRRNPMLLVVHGGPASPYIPFNPLLSSWEQVVTVVQWDQRGAGRTFVRNGPDPALTVDRLVDDGIQLARWITRELGHHRIILMGSSVGSVIASRMVRAEPQLFAQYVAANQVGVGSRADSWRQTRAALDRGGKRGSVAALDALGPDPRAWTAAQAEEVSKHAISASVGVPDMVYDLMLPALMYTPDYSMADIRAIDKSMGLARDVLYPDLRDPDLSGRYEVPLLLVHGERDLVNPVSAVANLLPLLDAPRVELVTVEHAGHLVEFADPERFAQILREHVLSQWEA